MDIIVFISVFSVVEMSICVKLYVVSVVILDLTMCWYMYMYVDVPNADFERYMNHHCTSWNFNDKQLQSVVSTFYGYYCIYFCIRRSRDV